MLVSILSLINVLSASMSSKIPRFALTSGKNSRQMILAVCLTETEMSVSTVKLYISGSNKEHYDQVAKTCSHVKDHNYLY